jgi:hypothetical protein
MTRPMGKLYRDAEHRERTESLPTQVIPFLERGAPGATPETHTTKSLPAIRLSGSLDFIKYVSFSHHHGLSSY